MLSVKTNLALVSASLLLMGMPSAFQGQPLEMGVGYELKSDSSIPLFSFHRREFEEGNRKKVEVEFRDPAGSLLAEETVTYQEGVVAFYQQVQHQLNYRFEMRVSGTRVSFEAVRDGEITHSEARWRGQTLIVDQIPSFVAAHWSRLRAGDEVSFRLVALDRQRIVEFRLKREGVVQYRSQDAVHIRMSAGSFFVRWFAPEVDLIFSAEGDRLLESRGPVPVKKGQEGSWEDVKARLVFD